MSLFGNSSNPPPEPNRSPRSARSSAPTTERLFGGSTTASATANATEGVGLFGRSSTPVTGGGTLFGASALSPASARSSTPATGGLLTFGASALSPATSTPSTGGLFGSSTPASTITGNATQGRTLFGASAGSSTPTTGGLFGIPSAGPAAASATERVDLFGGSGHPSNLITGASLFGASSATGGGSGALNTSATTTAREAPSTTEPSLPRSTSLFSFNPPAARRTTEGGSQTTLPLAATQPASTEPTQTTNTTISGEPNTTVSESSNPPEPVKDGVASIQFDPDGDVVLVLKSSSGTARFQVNSSVLCLVSPVFRAMLGAKSQFKEGKELASRESGAPPLEITLEDDNPNALAIVLRILHHQHDLVPKFVAAGKEKIFQLAVICDKYELQQALTYWMGQGPVDKLVFGNFKPAVDMFTGEKGLFMAYVFDRVDMFYATSRDLILNRSLRSTSSFEYLPQSIIDAILKSRSDSIQAILNCIRTKISLYKMTSSVQCIMKKPECDAFALGYITRELQKLGIYPETEGLREKSVKELQVDILRLNSPIVAIFDTHAGCCSRPTLCNCKITTPVCKNCEEKKCIACKQKHIPMTPGANHASCVPVAAIKNAVALVVHNITGLTHSRFVRNPRNNQSVIADSQLWDCVRYS